VSLEQLIEERGLNIISTSSGCHLATWVFQHTDPTWPFSYVDCFLRGNNTEREVHSEESIIMPDQILDAEVTVHHIQPYDTVYVNIKGLGVFVDTILPNLVQPIVLIAGNSDRAWRDRRAELKILENPYIIKWFIHSIDFYVEEWGHPKVAAWPYGIHHAPYGQFEPYHPVETFQKAMMKHLHTTKTKGIYKGYLNKDSNGKRAQLMDIAEKKDLPDYYEELAAYRFIVSPDGDRPECYRHYEAIGLGVIPITELSPITHPHFLHAPIVYGTSAWDENEEQLLRRMGLLEFPTVNRIVVFEEYWIEYVQRIVGRNDLRWFDRLAKRKSKFEDFMVIVQQDVGSTENATTTGSILLEGSE
jgi:hypothetical protein